MLSSHVAAYRIRFTFAMANVESDSMRLFEVTFRVCVLPDGYWYTAQIITGAEDEKSAKEEARKWFQAKQPYHKSDEDRLVATLDNFQVGELETFLCYGVAGKPSQWRIPRSRSAIFK